MSAIQAADVPTLNQNTTGTAANVTGTVAIANGGTGATTNTAARTALGATTLGSNVFTITNPSAVTFPRFNANNTVSALSAADFRTAIGAGSGAGTVTSVDVSGGTTGLSTSGGPITTSGTITIAGTLAVANGGTGATTLTANNVILGNGTSAVGFVAPGTSGNVLTSNGTTWTSAAAASLIGDTDSAAPFETSLGFEAGGVNTGDNNTFIGYQAGKANTTGANNVAVGIQALQNNTEGGSNTAVGPNALNSNTTGNGNIAMGISALQLNTTGGLNTAMGFYALSGNTTGASNTAVGSSAGDQISTGIRNTVIGDSAASSGTNDLTTGSNNTVIGYNAATSSASVSNTVTLGNSSIATLRCQVTTISSLSDARDKTNVKELSAGLDFVNELKPVSFTWNMRDGGKVGIPDTGFIAQDLQAVQAKTGITIPSLVNTENPDKLEAGYGKLLPVLVKAIQELSNEVNVLKAEINSLKGV